MVERFWDQKFDDRKMYQLDFFNEGRLTAGFCDLGCEGRVYYLCFIFFDKEGRTDFNRVYGISGHLDQRIEAWDIRDFNFNGCPRKEDRMVLNYFRDVKGGYNMHRWMKKPLISMIDAFRKSLKSKKI